MLTVASQLQAILRRALATLPDMPADFDASVTPAADGRFGDYQANAAMTLAKARRTNPRALAAQIVDALKADAELEKNQRAAGDRGRGVHQFPAETGVLGRATRRPRRRPRAPRAGEAGTAIESGDRFQFAQRRQADARRPPAFDDHRRLPDAGGAVSSGTMSSPTITSAIGERSSARSFTGGKKSRKTLKARQARYPPSSGTGSPVSSSDRRIDEKKRS